jgi:hypothetical protein
MVVEDGGNVGIGTSTPSAALEIARSGTNPLMLRLKGDSTTDYTDFRMSTFGDLLISPYGQSGNDGGIGIGLSLDDSVFSVGERLKVSGSTGIANTMTIESGEDAAFATCLTVDIDITNTNVNQGISSYAAKGSINRGGYFRGGVAGNTQVLNNLSNSALVAVAGENSTGTSLSSVGLVSIATRSSDEDNIGIWTSTLNSGSGDAIGLRLGYYNTTIATDFNTDLNGDLTIKPSGGTGAIMVTGAFGYEFTTTATLGANEHDFDTRGISALRVNAAGGTGTTITGFANGYDGKELVVFNVGSTTLTVNNQDGNSSANNRMINGSGGNNLAVSQDDCIKFKYDGTTNRWRMVSTTVSG